MKHAAAVPVNDSELLARELKRLRERQDQFEEDTMRALAEFEGKILRRIERAERLISERLGMDFDQALTALLAADA